MSDGSKSRENREQKKKLHYFIFSKQARVSERRRIKKIGAEKISAIYLKCMDGFVHFIRMSQNENRSNENVALSFSVVLESATLNNELWTLWVGSKAKWITILPAILFDTILQNQKKLFFSIFFQYSIFYSSLF